MVAGELYKMKNQKSKMKNEEFIQQLHDALYAATLLSYTQGLSLLHKASTELKMDVPVTDVVRIWRGGCIIRSAMLEIFYSVLKNEPQLENLLLNKTVGGILNQKEKSLRETIKQLVDAKIPCAAFMSTLGYFDAYSSKQLPTNLIQAQRDYFGAHGYQRIDREGIFHTEWQPVPEHEKEKPEHKP